MTRRRRFFDARRYDDAFATGRLSSNPMGLRAVRTCASLDSSSSPSALVAPLAHSADIYRWVDEQGRTHISDTVPERYRGVATRLDAKPIEPTAQQRAE